MNFKNIKILISGPESSGKSTLGKQLATQLNGTLIPEYARTYLNDNGPSYKEEDLLKIAQEHHLEYKKAIVDNPQYPIILDTFLLNIKIWSDVKYGRCHPWIQSKLTDLNFDHIFLLKPNVPWQDDPLRESKNSRNLLFETYKSEFEKLNWSYTIIDANLNERTNQALSVLKLTTF